MFDTTSVAILLGLVSVFTLYIIHKLYPNIIWVVFAILMLILSGTGYYITEGTPATQIFEIFIVLSSIGIVVSFLHLVFLLLKEIGEPMMKKHGGQKDY